MLALYLTVLFLVGLALSGNSNPITRPQENETVEPNKPYTILWEVGTPGPVQVAVYWRDSSNPYFLEASYPNNGSYVWNPEPYLPESHTGYNYYAEICDLVVFNDCTTSGRFSIARQNETETPPAPPPPPPPDQGGLSGAEIASIVVCSIIGAVVIGLVLYKLLPPMFPAIFPNGWSGIACCW